jgi:4-amino-4-deoxy-L-arabinose transferase-like glycosyltransferase
LEYGGQTVNTALTNKIILIIALLLGSFFRFYELQNNPPGFYSDEASYAYNAYSTLHTGKDEYGRKLPLVFEAFGDYKLPVMLYSIVGSFALFGDSNWSARLPGAVYGTLTILLIYILVKQLLVLNSQKKLTENQQLIADFLPSVSALILAVTPSHIFVSRGTWELTPALFFIIAGTIFFLKYLHPNSILKSFFFLLSSVLSFVLSLYSYNSARLFVPLFVFSLIVIFHKLLFQKINSQKIIQYIFAVLVAVLLCLPILSSITSPQVTQRAKYISIFYDKGVDGRLFDSIRADGGQPVLQTRLLHNKVIFYGSDFLQRYLSHFDPNFLFTIGDTFEIFQIIGTGFLPLYTIVLLPLGIYFLVSDRPKWLKILFVWLLISPIASSLTIFTPSTSRAMNQVIPLTIFSAYGLIYLYSFIKQKRFFIFLSSFVFCLFSSYLFYQYFILTPKIVAEKWNDGFNQSVQYVKENQDMYQNIVISSSQAPSYIFYLWYLRYDPVQFQNQATVDNTPDQNGLIFTKSFGKYQFTKDIKSEQLKKESNSSTLFIGFEGELKDVTTQIKSRNGNVVQEISK